MTELGIRLWLRVGIEERMDGDEMRAGIWDQHFPGCYPSNTGNFSR